MKAKRSTACPCSSGRPFSACCQPLIRDGVEATTAEALMRSRYSAFALGEVEHLIRTLHPEHPDAALPHDALRATLKGACRAYKYTGLSVLEHRTEGEQATVVFRAKVFDRGRDLSFTEASMFARTAEGWRYLSGETIDRAGAPPA